MTAFNLAVQTAVTAALRKITDAPIPLIVHVEATHAGNPPTCDYVIALSDKMAGRYPNPRFDVDGIAFITFWQRVRRQPDAMTDGAKTALSREAGRPARWL